MAETVYLLDGTMEVVLTEKDVFIERLIREKLGDDAARFVTEYIRELVEEAKYTEEAQQEAEKIADGYSALCNDALDTFRQLKELSLVTDLLWRICAVPNQTIRGICTVPL